MLHGLHAIETMRTLRVRWPAEASERLVGSAVFKTVERLRGLWRVRFPSASAKFSARRLSAGRESQREASSRRVDILVVEVSVHQTR